MKKILLLLTILVGAAFATSCEGPQGPPGQSGNSELPVPFKYTISFNEANNMDTRSYYHPVNKYIGDYVLFFVKTGNKNNNPNNPIYTQLPYREFVTIDNREEEIEYIADFSQEDFAITARASQPLFKFNNLNGGKSFTRNVEFLVVYVPAVDPRTTSAKSANANSELQALQAMSYEEVVAKYNIKESDVIKM